MKFTIEQAVEILVSTPPTLTALLGNLSPDWTASDRNRDDWAPTDVLGHLIHAEETDWIPRARVILAQGDDQRFPDFDRYGQFEKFVGKSCQELLVLFSERRTEGLATLRSWNLGANELSLTGVHPQFGEVTLEQLISTWVVHDLTHLRQISVGLAKKYKENVGPWEEFLSILR